MTLTQFYRAQFMGLCKHFEPHWSEDTSYKMGFRWLRKFSPCQETFQITAQGDEPVVLIYSLELPKEYIDPAVFDTGKSSYFELSMYRNANRVVVQASISIERLQQTVLGFINKVRGELIDSIYSFGSLK
jgi:hypothetical protein